MRTTPNLGPPKLQSIRHRTIKAIGANRTPGLHFPGYFLDVRWAEITDDSAFLTLANGPQCRTETGTLDLTALAVLADTALSTAARHRIAPGARLGTLHLQMQFTGMPANSDVSAEAKLLGLEAGTALQHLLSSATLRAGGLAICHASATFACLDPPPGVALAPLPWQLPTGTTVTVPEESELTSHECAILRACDRALAVTKPGTSFIQHFWGGSASRHGTTGASRRVVIGPHIGNRVGHVQGGILLGMAAATACDLAPDTMNLSNVSAWYISPGRGKSLTVRSRVMHAGRTIAAIRTQVRTSDRQLVLEAVTLHSARAPGQEAFYSARERSPSASHSISHDDGASQND
jgi:acyl-coenzyme A thioesterase PaaI-like protein